MIEVSLLSMQIGSALSLSVIALFVIAVLQKRVGLWRSIVVWTILGAAAIGFEYSSITTGFPYGKFVYSDMLGKKVFDIVPWTVFFGWTPLVLGAVAVSQRMTHKKLFQILFSAVILVLFDLVFDPIAVRLGFWEWVNPGMYFGIPLINFFGWFVTGIIGSAIVIGSVRRKLPKQIMFPFILLLGSSIFLSVQFAMLAPLIIGIALLIILLFLLIQ